MKKTLLLLSTTFLFAAAGLRAQASLAAENVIDDIKIKTKSGKLKTYTVFKEDRQQLGTAEQWYYMPNELRLAEELDVKGKVRPKMTILRYQHQDLITKENKQGGILVAAFTYAIEPEAVEQVKAQIRTKKGAVQGITLSAMPLNSATIDFLTANNQFVGNLDAKTFNGATSATQEMVLCYDLTELGAGVMKSLAMSRSGIPLRANITYNGLSAPCGVKIEGNWNNVYEYFEKTTSVQAKVGWGWFKFGVNRSNTTIRENLQSIKGMKVDIMDCGQAANGTELDPNVEDIVKTISHAVFSDNMMDRATELAQMTSLLNDPIIRDDPDACQKIREGIAALTKSVQLGFQKGTKDVQRRRTGSIAYDYKRKRMILRSSTLGGLLSLAKYGMTEETLVKEGYIIDLDANKGFPSVVIGLPNLNPDWDIRALTLEVSFKGSDQQTKSEARQWLADKGWTTVAQAPSGYIRFNLIGEKNKKLVEEPTFKLKLQVISKIPNASFVVEKEVKLSSGERYIDALELLTKQYIFDGTGLDYSKMTNNPTDLAFAKLTMSKGVINLNKDIKPLIINGLATIPPLVHLLLPKDETPDPFKIVFTTNTGEKVDRRETIELGENTLNNFEWKIKN
ncbi:MAG: hypothetical protein RLZZ628_3633 [Bacteroidota bacterium]|jgi:hypothetical protein